MKKRPHNFYIDDDVWEEFRVYCLRKKTTATGMISNFIKNKIKKRKK